MPTKKKAKKAAKKVEKKEDEVEEEETTTTDEEVEEEDDEVEEESEDEEDEGSDEVEEGVTSGIQVGSPEILRPKKLPLVVTPPKGKNWNAAQQQYIDVINGYAYRNPKKFEKKKKALIENLIVLGKEPDLLAKFMGTNVDGIEGQVSFKDQRIQK